MKKEKWLQNGKWDLLKNCSVGRSWHTAHLCNLKLTSISYNFWNKGWKVLKFRNFDETRGSQEPVIAHLYELLPSIGIRRLSKLFQKSSPLKPLGQFKPNLVWIITRVSSFKIVSGDTVHQPTWPLLLKIEHMVKLQVFG